MGNEESLAGFPVKQVVPALVTLLQMEHNFDMMHHACRDPVHGCGRAESPGLGNVGAIGTCLMYLDFFSVPAQRAALAIAASCCQSITSDEMHFVRDSLPLLTARLGQHSPPLVSSSTFVMVCHMLVIMCAHCPDLAVILLKEMRDADTTMTESIELPTNGIFCVDSLLRRGSSPAASSAISWQWRDDRGSWHTYAAVDSNMIEAAHQAGDYDVSLQTMGRTYTIDLDALQQVNEDTGTTRPVQRKTNAPTTGANQDASHALLRIDSRADVLLENSALASAFIKTLFGVLYEVYSSSVNAMVEPDYWSQASKCDPNTAGAMATATHCSTPHGDTTKGGASAAPNQKILQRLSDMLKRKKPPKKSLLKKGSNLSLSSGTNVDTTQSNIYCTVDSSTGTTTCRHTPWRRGQQQSRFAPSVNSRTNLTIAPPTLLSPPDLGCPVAMATGSGTFAISVNSDWMALPSLPRSSTVSTTTTGQGAGFGSNVEMGFAPPPRSAPASTGREAKSGGATPPLTFAKTYFSEVGHSDSHPALGIMTRLTHAANALQSQMGSTDQGVKEETEGRASGCMEGGVTTPDMGEMEALRVVSEVVQGTDVSPFEIIHSGVITRLLTYLTTSPSVAMATRELHLRRFLQEFLRCPPPEVTVVNQLDLSTPPPLSALVSKLMGCLHHLEQVKVHDLPEGAGTSGRGSSALRFLSTHQLKCVLERHPSCNNLRPWKGGPVKIDPLALIQAIERYLLVRGYGRVKPLDSDDICSDDDNSDDDIDDTLHRLEFVVGSHVVPYDMTVYQAVRQYSPVLTRDGACIDAEHPLANTEIWAHTHIIQYRTVSDNAAATGGASPSSSSTTVKVRKTRAEASRRHSANGHSSGLRGSLDEYLVSMLPGVTVNDPSLETSNETNALSYSVFVSSKLTAKANRQLLDPLVILTGNLPNWLREIGTAWQMLFYATAFDRDRVMQRLQDMTTDVSPTNFSDRVTPRLERKKRADLDLWRGETVTLPDTNSTSSLIPWGQGPLGRKSGRSALANRIRTKCIFLGKFMAKAIMDSRMIDLPLSVPFYKWLLGLENTMTSADLDQIDPVLAKSFNQLEQILREKKRIEADCSHGDDDLFTFPQTAESCSLALNNLALDGCSIDDLHLDFLLPGYPNIELKKGGTDIPLEQLFCGSRFERWAVRMLDECCRPDHGYTSESTAVHNLYKILSSYDVDEQRQFLQFVTGSPRLPVGGLRSLNPPLTIVKKVVTCDSADAYLPSVMTCVNYLKLPDYSTEDVMRQQLAIAAREGQLSFHLS
ncbi:hypothetical protein NP493_1414g01032 [Ridgeia piscesae]|uniref:E3 ubiquitin-protein ligase n=1 Tax=Ridgeia piscesae TaxID=27915 RepID=A0AAD9K3T7_RIDPI|nr:hypothetical protein NP493_1414g01032 [Ridgeia piscesae]